MTSIIVSIIVAITIIIIITVLNITVVLVIIETILMMQQQQSPVSFVKQRTAHIFIAFVVSTCAITTIILALLVITIIRIGFTTMTIHNCKKVFRFIEFQKPPTPAIREASKTSVLAISVASMMSAISSIDCFFCMISVILNAAMAHVFL